jgi:hypothetical protein
MDTLNTIVTFVPIGMFVFIVVYFIRLFTKKPDHSKSKNIKEEKPKKTARFKHTDFLNNVKDIDDNFILTKDGWFVAALKCSGVSPQNLSDLELSMVVNSYQETYDMVNHDIRLHTQSRLINATKHKDGLVGDIEGFNKKIKQLQEELKKLVKIYKSEQDSETKEMYRQELIDMANVMDNYNTHMQIKMEEDAYIRTLASSKNRSQFDNYIMVPYFFNEADFNRELSEDEIKSKAADYLETKCNSLIYYLGKANVVCIRANKIMLSEIAYRDYNMSDADIIPLDTYLQTSAFDMITTSTHARMNKAKIGIYIEKEMDKNEAAE